MEELKTEIKQIKLQILTGIKQDRIDLTWGNMIIDTCNKALTLHDVVGSGTELLCVDVGDAMWLTKDKKYTLIEEENENYLIEGDQKLKNWYSKNKFKVLEAQ